MENKGLTISIIFEAESGNYGESNNNMSELKKLTRGDGNTYSYISRQALRYNIVDQLKWINAPLVQKEGGVIQYDMKATIVDCPEIDLFGYMKTSKKKKGEKQEDSSDKEKTATRNAVVRLSNAIALESYAYDSDYLTNMGLAKRENMENAIVQIEIHKSYYAYTITIDLDRIGVDADLEIANEEKAKRVNDFLNVVKTLYRDIKGRRENLMPVFVVGGVYDQKVPYFENRLKVSKNCLKVDIIKSIMDIAGENTSVGYLNGIFNNEEEIKTLSPKSIGDFFNDLESKVSKYYE